MRLANVWTLRHMKILGLTCRKATRPEQSFAIHSTASGISVTISPHPCLSLMKFGTQSSFAYIRIMALSVSSSIAGGVELCVI